LELTKQRKNALDILKQWEMELNLKNEFVKNNNSTKIKGNKKKSMINQMLIILGLFQIKNMNQKKCMKKLEDYLTHFGYLPHSKQKGE